MKTFDKFTNQYSLSKTLRFELKPEGKTDELLKQNAVFEKDAIIKQKYEATKPYFDRLHREFVQEALENVDLSLLEGYMDVYNRWMNDQKNTDVMKELQNTEKALRSEVVVFFNDQAKVWFEKYPGLKNKTTQILHEEAVFTSLLKARYGKEENAFVKDENGNDILDKNGEKMSIFDEWKGFTGYFTKFFETRKNFYKDDGTSTATATRIIDQNLRRFCGNVRVMHSLKGKIDFSSVEKDCGKTMDEIFSLPFYNQCLLQDGIDFYNTVLGGKLLASGEKKQGINELINQYRQKNKEDSVGFLKLLDKQILGEKDTVSFIDEIENDEELGDAVRAFYETAEQKTQCVKTLFADFVQQNDTYDLTKVYITKEALNTIFYKWTAEVEVFQSALFDVLNQKEVKAYYNLLRKEKNDPQIKKEKEEYKFPHFVKLSHIKEALENIDQAKLWQERYYKDDADRQSKGFLSLTTQQNVWEQFLQIFDFEFSSLFRKEIIDAQTGNTINIGYDVFAPQLKELLTDFENSKETKVVIKDFADCVLHIYQMAKYFALEKKRKWVGDDYDMGDFYENPDYGYKAHFYDGAYEDIVKEYNKLRNYLTKKPYSEEKWKLNFENATLADGWDKNKEPDNFAVILRRNNEYFLGLMAKGHNKIFDDRFKDSFCKDNTCDVYEKMVYKYFPDQAKMFPKVCFSAKGLDFFHPSEEIVRIYQNAEFKKGDTFLLKSMHKLIDFYKSCLEKYEGWKCYNFKHLKPTKEYRENIGEFFRDVAEDGYRVTFQDISEEYIKEKNESGELYLFKIKNKDWSKGATGAKNLHTLYFEALFSEENATQNFPFKLNGQAEIFYRPKTEGLDKEKIVTKEKNITLEKGDKAFQKKRYTENKVFFHVPLTVNRTKGDIFRFNVHINNFLAHNPDINVIGVDRGEKHLAYYSVINQKQEILDSGTLNEIAGVNYAEKLAEKAKNREQERKDWQSVESIKDLKRGYISQVVRKLADLAIKHNAIIVFEDLNMRFKQIRGGIEKSVYQQLEKALIEKLNFLVDKGEMDPQKAGHLMRAYQLTAPFTTFKDMGKQTGILFYTQASYTSKIDPVTGWRPHIYLKYTSAEKAKTDIAKLSQITFTNNRFEFTYDRKNFLTSKKVQLPQKTQWTICSCVERHWWNRKLNSNKGGYEHYEDLTENFKKLFDEYGIDYKDGDIMAQIATMEARGNQSFFKSFIFLFRLMCQIRNTQQDKSGDENDFILSPVAPFFDTRKSADFGDHLPKNGDDNGAYNIARKGLIILDKISRYEEENDGCEKMKWGDLYVSHVDWDDFAQRLVK